MTGKIVATAVVSTLIIGAFVVIMRASQVPDVHPAERTDFHTSMYYFDNKDFFQSSVATFGETLPLAPSPRIYIVNQHILAAHIIARQFALSRDPTVKTVVLITQNNWNAGRAPIITSRYGWRTPLGTIMPNKKLVDGLVALNLALVDEDIYTTEHGITGIVPYIAHAYPNASLVTLVIRDGAPETLVDALAAQLGTLDLNTTVVVGSIDMSHYLPKYVADIHDRMTLESIRAFDYEALPRLDVDTAPTLRTLMKVAQQSGNDSFVLTGHINSADIIGDPELMVTTSYMSGYFAPGATSSMSNNIHMLFVGDIMLDRGIAMHARKFGIESLFAKVERLFLGTHAVVGNLEGTITDKTSLAENTPSLLRFTFAPKFANVLHELRFTLLSSANNHAYDFGADGYAQTRTRLALAGILQFGSPKNAEYLSTKIIKDGKTLCFVGYHDLFTYDALPALQEVRTIRPECNYVVVFAHWGEEYVSTATARQKLLAHQFVEAGADLVIGAHPHVVGPIEIYQNKAIFYSLGNFMFDQDFSYETTQGLAVHVEWGAEKTIFNLIPITITRGEVSIAKPTDRRKTLTATTRHLSSEEISTDILTSQHFTIWNNK